MHEAPERSLIGSVLYQLVKWPGLFLLWVHERMVKFAVDDPPFYSNDAWPWVKDVEQYYPDIRREYLQLVAEDAEAIPSFQVISQEQKRLTQDTRWKIFAMMVYGKVVDTNAARCPKTMEAISHIPGANGALFSVMEGPKHIPAHRGPFKGVLRYHMGVLVPEPDKCEIRVADEKRSWREGESLIFDDYYDHEAWNKGDQVRVVLFVDFMRPLPAWAAPINRLLFALISGSAFVTSLVKNAETYTRERGGASTMKETA